MGLRHRALSHGPEPSIGSPSALIVRPHQLGIGREAECALANDLVADADRLARLNGADEDDIRLDAHDLAQMNAGRRRMGDKIAEANMLGHACYRVMASGNGLARARPGAAN